MESTLTADEFASLQELNKGPHAVAVPPEHKQRLLALGLIEMRLKEPVVTDAGHKLLTGGR